MDKNIIKAETNGMSFEERESNARIQFSAYRSISKDGCPVCGQKLDRLSDTCLICKHCGVEIDD